MSTREIILDVLREKPVNPVRRIAKAVSEYHFLLGDDHMPKQAIAIAKKHGATLVNYTDAQCRCGYGCRPHSCKSSRRHWFAGPNRGEPFNSRLADAVSNDLKAAKLLK